MFQKQIMMRRVLYSLAPIFLFSVYLYGWRSLAVTATSIILGTLTEYFMERSRKKPVSEAVLVTCVLYALSLPPKTPLWIVGVGIVFAVFFGKEVYGGFGAERLQPGHHRQAFRVHHLRHPALGVVDGSRRLRGARRRGERGDAARIAQAGERVGARSHRPIHGPSRRRPGGKLDSPHPPRRGLPPRDEDRELEDNTPPSAAPQSSPSFSTSSA